MKTPEATEREPLFGYVLKVACLSAAYVLTAYLTLFLVIPPNYASPVWPAAAVALVWVAIKGYRYLPGVGLGALIVSLYQFERTGVGIFFTTAMGVSFLVAMGATLQAAFGAYLIKRYVDFERYLIAPKNVLLVFLLGGPLSCVVNSMVGTVSLWAVGALPAEAMLNNWFTWWLGDSLGVFCFGPLLVLVLSPRRSFQPRVKWGATAALMAVFSLVLVGIMQIKEVEFERQEELFRAEAEKVYELFSADLDVALEPMRAMGAVLSSEEAVSDETLKEISRSFVERSEALKMLSWGELSGGGIFSVEGACDPNSAYEKLDGRAVAGEDELRKLGRGKVFPLASGVGGQIEGGDRMLALLPVSDSVEGAVRCLLAGYDRDVLFQMIRELPRERGIDVRLRAIEDEQVLLDERLASIGEASVPAENFVEFPVSFAGAAWRLELREGAMAASRNDSGSLRLTTIWGCMFTGAAGLVILFVSGRSELVGTLVREQIRQLNKQAGELERSNRELTELAQKAESANVAKSQFLAAMSHEIRTPMNGILGVLHILREDLPERSLAMLEVARQSADKLLVLINDILDLSKIEEGKMTLEMLEISSLSVVEEVCELHAVKARDKGIVLSARVRPEDCCIFRGDSYRLGQVLSNLVSNAVKFTEGGRIEVSCKLLGKGGRESIQFRVKDTGIGIPDEYRENLFKPFTQADRSTTRKHGGSGLGLSICLKIVELMGGGIELAESEEVGSEFIVTLPLASPSIPRKIGRPVLRGRSVALVHPDEGFREYIREWMELWGGTLFLASSADALGRVADGVDFDFCLIDESVWSGRNGLEGRLETCFIGYNQPEDAWKLRNGDKATVLIKPVRIENLFPVFDQLDQPAAVDEKNEKSMQQTRVLLVDDNPTNTMVAAAILKRRHQIEPDTAENGLVALDLMKDKEYDVVYMDCMMPELDGYATTRAIRKGDAGVLNQSTPIIALTANAMKEDERICLDSGMSDYIAKPVDPKRIEKSLVHWVGRSHPVDS
ncbi:ATP-binding protein [Pelagicoccus mobilis]|uniref:histidine kinase n=1 Tax=Pelagicoccus mobilis TaxID=415221 RepID=A0A934RTF8_9BACT|nr:ATP-binding protein [Pelagicoccus mobilis]MBK1876557.1 response regulator [Pelagicoccus mobilis]